MADAAQIEMVKDLLPTEAEAEGWDSTKIGLYLDAPNTAFQTVALYWESKAAKLYQMIDVSESGSTRSLSRIYDNAKAMAEYWRGRYDVQREEDGHTRLHMIKRV